MTFDTADYTPGQRTRIQQLEAEVARMREGWDADVDWANKLLIERDRLREALIALADEATFAVCEPRRFHENEDHRQQALGNAIARARLVADELVRTQTRREETR